MKLIFGVVVMMMVMIKLYLEPRIDLNELEHCQSTFNYRGVQIYSLRHQISFLSPSSACDRSTDGHTDLTILKEFPFRL